MNVFWGFEDPQSWVPVCRSVSKSDTFTHTGKEEAVVPGLELSIPDVQAGTQILIQISLHLTASQQYSYARLYRNEQGIAQGDAAGSRTPVTISAQMAGYTNDKWLLYGVGFSYLDTVSQTGDVRYTVRIANSYYAQAITVVNRSSDDSDASYSHRGISTLTAITLSKGLATAGPPGPRGANGPMGPRGADGPQGVAGDRGAKGDIGPAGPQGQKGDPGTRGRAGNRGPKGDKGSIGPAGPQGPKGDEGPVLPSISRWLPASYSESFCLDQVTLWFCADQYLLGNMKFSSAYNLQEISNSSRFEKFQQFALKYVSGSRAVLKWKTVGAHYRCGENKTPWRSRLLISDINAYHYYLSFYGCLYRSPYPLASKKNVFVVVVYQIKGYKAQEIVNFLFSSGTGIGQRGLCFSPADRSRCGKQCIRIYGVDNPENSIEFANWGKIRDPTAINKWNVIGIWWRPSGKKSSLWINYGKDHLGGKMLEFVGSKSHTGESTTIGNHTSGDYDLNGWVSNFEAYDTDFVCEEFVKARMKFLSDQYGVEDSPYATVLEPGPRKHIDDENGTDPREVSPEFEE